MTDLLKHTYKALSRLDTSMTQLRRAGLGPGVEAYDILARTRSEIWRSVGLKQPKVTSMLLRILGLSPGIIKVWHDAEYGWMSEARVKAGAPPIYHYISDEQAVAILNKEISAELEDYLMTPDDYIGE